MNIILLGAPGAGKGTQAANIASKYNIPHISTGDIFRKNIKEQTPIGVKAKSYIDRGELVPDEVVIEIVRQRLKEADCKNGYLLDGFPRTENQAEALSKITKIDRVINLDIDTGLLLKRITGRRLCTKCSEPHHIDALDGKSVCRLCGETLYQRDDDKESTVANRLNVYNNQTLPLINYYKGKKLLINVDADGTIAEVGARINKILK